MLVAIALLSCQGSDTDGVVEPPPDTDVLPGDGLGTGLSPTALRRLAPSAWQNTVRDLFPGVALPEIALVPDPLAHGFDNNGETQAPSALLVGQLSDGAVAIAAAAAADPETAFGCPADGGPDPLACGTAFLSDFGPRAWRRPLGDDELRALVDPYAEVLATDGFEVAIQVAVQLVLQTPEFLYLPELSTGSPGTVVPLSGYEVASRLSFFLWNTMPDEALFAAAASGKLDTAEGVAAEARRMLDAPRSRAGVDNFDRLWLSLDAVDDVSLDPATYPTFGDATRDEIRDETLSFARRMVLDGTLEGLLTDPSAELGPETAALYGVPLPPAGTLAELPAGERSGLLTRAAFLATRAHAVHPSPVKRGVFVLDRLLCTPPAPPPADVDTSVPVVPDDAPTTNRERYAAHVQNERCASCHDAIDGIGFGFEHYDSMGSFRLDDGGFPVDATGSFVIGDLAGVTYDGAIEASEALAASRTVSDCVTESWARYALGRSLGRGDEATLAALSESFSASGGRFRDLLVEIAKSDAFRSRRIE